MLKNPLGVRWGLLPTLQWMGSWLSTYPASFVHQVERRFHSRKSNHQPLHSETGTSPLSPNSLGSSWTTVPKIRYGANFRGFIENSYKIKVLRYYQMIQNITKQVDFVIRYENNTPGCTNPMHGDFDSDWAHDIPTLYSHGPHTLGNIMSFSIQLW